MSISARCWRWKRKPRDSNSNPKTETSMTVSAARAKSPVCRDLSRATQCAIVFLRDIAVGVVPEHRGRPCCTADQLTLARSSLILHHIGNYWCRWAAHADKKTTDDQARSLRTGFLDRGHDRISGPRIDGARPRSGPRLYGPGT